MIAAAKMDMDKDAFDENITSLNAVQLLIRTYDIVIAACDQRNGLKACEALSRLKDSLNFDYPEIADALLSLYEHCIREVRRDNYDGVSEIIQELKSPWIGTQGNG